MATLTQKYAAVALALSSTLFTSGCATRGGTTAMGAVIGTGIGIATGTRAGPILGAGIGGALGAMAEPACIHKQRVHTARAINGEAVSPRQGTSTVTSECITTSNVPPGYSPVIPPP